MWLFEGLLVVIKVIRGWIIKISLLVPSVVTWQYHWESSPLSRLYDPSSHDQHYHRHHHWHFWLSDLQSKPTLMLFCTCPCPFSFCLSSSCSSSHPGWLLPNLYNFCSISPLPPSLFPMAGDHLNVAFHLKLRHMNEHYRILSHKPIWV